MIRRITVASALLGVALFALVQFGAQRPASPRPAPATSVPARAELERGATLTLGPGREPFALITGPTAAPTAGDAPVLVRSAGTIDPINWAGSYADEVCACEDRACIMAVGEKFGSQIDQVRLGRDAVEYNRHAARAVECINRVTAVPEPVEPGVSVNGAAAIGDR